MNLIWFVLQSSLPVRPTMLARLQGLEWLHKHGRSFSDLKPDNIRVQMGQQPGTFCHVSLVDLGGSVKFKGEQPSWGLALVACWVAYCSLLLCPAAARHHQLGAIAECLHLSCHNTDAYMCWSL